MSNAITWIGRSTVLVELDSMRLLTDPALRSRVAHLRRAGPLDDAEALRRGVGAVLIFHLHHDHLDLPSLERLGRCLWPCPAVQARCSQARCSAGDASSGSSRLGPAK